MLIALAVIMVWLRPPVLAPLQEGRRLIDAVGWAAILPQMLASLGAVFLAAGVGDQVGRLFAEYIPLDIATLAVIAYCIGMALFTILMGNAFAAFPVMTAAVGLPVVVHQFGGDPAIVCAIGMLAGFCGTLMTPMAANFNVVPANLLELPDRKAALNGVIRAQIPTALPLLVANIVLMRFLAFPVMTTLTRDIAEKFADARADACRPRVSEQDGSRVVRAGRCHRTACGASDFLRHLRLAHLRAWLLAAGAAVAALSGSWRRAKDRRALRRKSDGGERRRRSRLSRPAGRAWV